MNKQKLYPQKLSQDSTLVARSTYSVFFGDAQTCIAAPKMAAFADEQEARAQELNLEHLIFLKQEHTTDGVTIDDTYRHTQLTNLFSTVGDFLITDQKNIGLGILTADCLPVIVYDREQHVIGIAHAGWRGSLAGITEQMIHAMQKKWGCHVSALNILLGPAAHVCCYEVGSDFVDLVDNKKAITQKDNRFYFDNITYNIDRLIALGIDPDAINTEYSSCTICDTRYHSYRRASILKSRRSRVEDQRAKTDEDGPRSRRSLGEDGRQATIVWLQKPH